MRKITSLILFSFLLSLNIIKAQCVNYYTGANSLDFVDPATNALIGGSMACNRGQFFVFPQEPAGGSPINQYNTPCIRFMVNPTNANSSTRHSITLFEGAGLVGCTGPVGTCTANIGPMPNGSNYQLFASYMDPNSSHTYSICNTVANPPNMNYTVASCYNNTPITTGVWTTGAAGCNPAIVIPAGAAIGSSTTTISPFVAGAVTSFQFGAAIVTPSLLTVGTTYTLTYTFDTQNPACALTVVTRTFVLTNPYSSTWTAPTSPLCTAGACTSLNAMLTGTSTAGGFWTGTGVSGSNFCPVSSGAGSFPVTYTVGITPTCGSSTTRTINVNLTPTANAGTTQSLTCTNATTVLSGSGGGTYAWTGPGITGGGATANPTVNATGIYSLAVTVSSCTSAQSTVAVVQNTVTPVVAASGNSLNCVNTVTTVVASTTTSPVSFTWTGTGITSGSNLSTANVNQPGTFNYTVTNTDNGCRTSGNVTVTQNTVAPVVAASGNSLNCVNTSTTIVSSTTTTPVNYLWSGTGITGGSTTGTATVNQAGVFTYSVTNSNNGCQTTGNVTVTQNTTAPSVAASAGSLNCTNTSTTVISTTTTTPVTYNWTGTGITAGAATGTATVNQPGTFNYTVTNTSNGCVTAGNVSVIQNTTAPTVAASAGSLNCINTSTQVVSTTSTTPVSYTWTGTGITAGANTGTATVNQAGTFNYTVTNTSNGCRASGNVSVTQNTTAPSVAASAGSLNCTNTSTTIASTTTTTPVSYNWTGTGITAGAATGTATVNQAGTFNYTVTNTNNGCSTTGNVSVTQNTTAPTVAASAGSLNCTNTSTTIVSSTTTTPVTYNWTGTGITAGAATGTATVNQPGTFNYTVTNTSNGCTTAGNVIVTQNTVAPTVTASATGSLNCTTTTVQTIASTTASPVSYNWTGPGVTGGATTASATVNAGGTYNYSVTNTSNGCRTTGNISVSQSSGLPSVSSSVSNSLNCTVSTASVIATTTSTPVTYNWSGPSITGGATTGTASVNGPGSYIYTVTNTANLCTVTGTLTVTQNTTAPTVTASSGSLNCTVLSNTVLASTTVTPVSYNWSGPGVTGGATAATATVNAGGTYNYTVTNTNNNCVTTGNISVSQNTTQPSVTASASNSLNCTTTTVQAIATTSVSPVTYNWSGPGITAGATTASATVNAGGTYNYTVTNTSNNCVTSGTLGVAQNTTQPSVTATANGSLDCITTSTTIALTTTTSPVSYTWTGPGITAGSNAATATVNVGGTYNYTVTDAGNNCRATGTLAVTQNTTAPTVTATASSSLNCTTTSTTVVANTTVSPASYNWTGPGVVSGASTASATVNMGGTYNYTVTNTSNGCSTANTVSVTQNTTIPPTPTVSVTGSITCTAPQVTLTAVVSPTNATVNWTGGVCGPLTALTTTACASGSYSLIATDPYNNCPSAAAVVSVAPNPGSPVVSVANNGTITCTNTLVTVTATVSGPMSYTWTGTGITGPTTNSLITVTAGGNFTVLVTNTLTNCTSLVTNSVTADNTPVTLTTTASSTITCNTTSITLNANTGGGAYTYTWTGPAIAGSNSVSTVTVTTGGTYTVDVTNTNNGCVSSETISAVTNTTIPSGITLTATTPTLSCTTPTTQIMVSSTGGSTYSWTAPATGSLMVGANTATVDVSGPGVYTVVVTGTNGCSAPASSSTIDIIANSNSPSLSLTANSVSITCLNPAPSVTATPTGTVTVATYSWSPAGGISSGANSASPTFTAPGTYSAAVTATNGCVTSSVIVTVASDNTIPTATLTGGSIALTCTTTSLVINPVYSPTTAALSYTWAGTGIIGATNNSSITVDQNGTYTVSFINPANGCANTETVSVTGGTVTPTATIVSSSTIGVGCTPTTSTITLTASGTPTTGQLYNWTGPVTGTNSTLSTSSPGTYTVTVTDALSGCSATDVFAVANNTTIPSISAGSNGFLPCGAGATYTLNGTSSAPTSTYTWAGAGIVSGSNTAMPVINMSGTYTLMVTDSVSGCSATSTVSVMNSTVNAAFVADVTSGVSPLTVNFTNNSLGASSYNWTFGDGSVSTSTNPSNTYTMNGTFTVNLIASSGSCSDTSSVVIEVEDGLIIEIPNVFTPNDDGVNDFFTITSKGVKDLTLEVYNRWGQRMYEFNGAKASWDGYMTSGNKASEGTYVYMVKAVGFDGQEVEKKGTFTLFR